MAYISTFTYCDTIQTEMTPQGPKHQIMNPLQVLAPIAIPGNFSFSIACNISGFEIETENVIRLTFEDLNSEILYDTGEVKFQIPIEQVQGNGVPGIQFNIDIRNIIFKEIGLCTTRVNFNGEELGNYKIQVIKGEFKWVLQGLII